MADPAGGEPSDLRRHFMSDAEILLHDLHYPPAPAGGDPVRDRLAHLLAEHQPEPAWAYRTKCSCGEWQSRSLFREQTRLDDHRTHVADALVEALRGGEDA